MLKKTVLSLAVTASLGLAGSLSAADFGLPPLGGGSGSGGAKIGGSHNMDIEFKNVIALGGKGSSKAMVGHISDGSSIGGKSEMRIKFGNAIALGVGGNACIAIGTVGGHC
ncbi:MAG: hypothetical protein GY862_21085 [Gammaproteobacteria bacterium]|nr:hypothetical protein [Gammaproteobacteria bacterium]